MPFSLTVQESLTLRLLQADAAAIVFAEIDANRSYLRQWLPWVDDSQGPQDARPFLENSWIGYHQGLGFSLGIFSGDEFCGSIGFHAFDQKNRITSLGYWLSEAFTGQGIMTACVCRMIEYAINDRFMNRIYIRCATGNLSSRAIPERLGFVHEGTQREAEWLYDRYVDLEMYSILAKEWRLIRKQS